MKFRRTYARPKNTNLCCQLNPVATCKKCKRAVCELHAPEVAKAGNIRGIQEFAQFNIVTCPSCVLRESEASIKKAILTNGPYSHNICSCALRTVSKAWDTEKANELIDKYKLRLLYKIHKEEEK